MAIAVRGVRCIFVAVVKKGDAGSGCWIAALGQHARGEPSRSPFGAAMFDFYMIEAKPENLIGDRAYDRDPLDAELGSR